MDDVTAGGTGSVRASSGTGPVAKPALLFLCQTLPFPPDGGVEIRSYNVMRLLAQSFDVTALCFYRAATRGTAQQVAEGIRGLSEFAEVEAFPIPHEQSRVRLVWDHLRSTLAGRAYTYFTYQSESYRSRIAELLAERDFDLVHLDSLDLSAYLPQLEGIPVVCTHQNVESDLLHRRAPTESSMVMRQYVKRQANLTAEEERQWGRRVALNVAVSEGDARRLAELSPGARITVVPNGVDTEAFQPFDSDGPGLVFVGGYSWYPNRDAMAYFCESILPSIRARAPDVPVTWVGRAPAPVAEEYLRRHNVRLTGYVEDIRPYVQDAACYIVPLRVGGGSRLKILDAWAMGKAIVSTTVGCEGLDARDGDNIVIRDSPAEFADAVLSVLHDADLRNRTGRAARRTAEEQYDWNVLGEHMISQYRSLLPTRR